MHKIFIFIPTILLFISSIFSQSTSSHSFNRLEAVGDFPQALKNILNKDSDIGEDKAFILANEEIRYLIRDGRILYGDAVTTYLESILDQLLTNEPDLRKQIQIYTLKSSAVNAVMYPNGVMLLNVGLIAQSTNEAELAFIISHELIHYIEKHAWEKSGKIRSMESFLQYHSRSREMETEADKLGVELFYMKAGYSPEAINGVFDVLQYAYLPFDEVPMKRSYFEEEFYKMNDKYFLESVTPISTLEKSVDTFSTHPNMHNRREEMKKQLLANPFSGNLFIQGREKYNDIRTLARFETINQQLIDDKYLMSYYNVFVMQQEEGENAAFLDVARVASLYGIYKMKKANRYAEYMPKAKEMEGEIQFAANFFEKINRKELALLCLRDVWQMWQKYPENEYLYLIFNDVVADMANYHNLKTLAVFSDYGITEEGTLDNENVTDENKENISKYDKIKTGKKTGHQKDFKTENYMLVDLKKDTAFVNAFEEALLKNEKEQAQRFIKMVGESEKKKLKEEKDFLVFRPMAYEYIKRGSNYYIKDRKTGTHTKRLEKRILRMAERNKINAEIISNNLLNFTSGKIKDYQAYSRINDFYRNMNIFSEIVYESRDIKELQDKINIRYLNIVVYDQYAINSIANPWYKFFYGVSSVAQYPFLPVGIYQFIHREHEGRVAFIVYDMKDSKMVYANNRSLTHENAPDEILQVLYEEYYKANVNIIK